MDQEAPPSNIQRIPLKERNLVQYFVAKAIFGDRPDGVSKEEWGTKTSDWYLKNGKTISEIIDNTENKNIRDLITAGKYQESAELVIKMLNEDKTPLAA
jgi:hypothetical protein